MPLFPTPPNGNPSCAQCHMVPFTVTPPEYVLSMMKRVIAGVRENTYMLNGLGLERQISTASPMV